MFAANLLSAFLATAPIQTDCLFILAHAGETNDLLPVMEEMQKQERDFRILPLGVSQELVQTRIDPSHILKMGDYQITIDKEWPNDRELPQEKIDAVVEHVHPKVVVTGVPLMAQKQFLEAYRGQAKTIAFWDCPEPRGGILYFSVALKVQAEAEKVLLPSEFVATAREFQQRKSEEKIVVGKPTLLPYLNDLQHVDRKSVLQKVRFNLDRPIITFIGTYGDRYERAFELFVRSLKTPTDAQSQIQVIFQMHPMATGEFETKCCKKLLGEDFPYIISPKDPERGIPLLTAMSIADKVVTYNSSAGFQAMLGNKPIFYVVPQGDLYTNSLIEQQLALKMTTLEQIRSALFTTSIKRPKLNLIDSMGIPLNPVERILKTIDEGIASR